MNKQIFILLGVLVIGLAIGYFAKSQSTAVLSGLTRSSFTTTGSFNAAGSINTSSTLDVTGLATLRSGAVIGSSGATLTKLVTGTATWNPGNLSPGAATSTEFAVTGISAGLPCFAGHANASSSGGLLVEYFLTCRAGTSTAFVTMQNAASSTADVDVISGTLTITQIQ
jgi:hypothetical protein